MTYEAKRHPDAPAYIRGVPDSLGSAFNEWLCDNTETGQVFKSPLAGDFPGIAHLSDLSRRDRGLDLLWWLMAAQYQEAPHLAREGNNWRRV